MDIGPLGFVDPSDDFIDDETIDQILGENDLRQIQNIRHHGIRRRRRSSSSSFDRNTNSSELYDQDVSNNFNRDIKALFPNDSLFHTNNTNSNHSISNIQNWNRSRRSWIRLVSYNVI